MYSHFTTVQSPWWDDRPLIVIGGGPSLEPYNCTDLRDLGRVLLLNDVTNFCKGDVLMSMDANWMRRSQHLVEEFEGDEVWLIASRFVKPIVTPTKAVLNYLRRGKKEKLIWGDRIYAAGNVGYAALNLAYLKKAKQIYLLGYDMNEGPHNQWHDHEAAIGLEPRPHYLNYYKDWPRSFDELAPTLVEAGIDVVNCNPGSSVRCFRFSTYEEFGLSQLVETSTN